MPRGKARGRMWARGRTFLLRFSSQKVTNPGTDIHSHVTLTVSPTLQRYTMLQMARKTSRPQA